MTQTYHYHATPGGSQRLVTIAEDGLRLADGPLHHWSEVRSLNFSGQRHGGRVSMGLTLVSDHGKVHLGFNSGGRDILDYHMMLRAAMRACAAARPDLTVTRGYAGIPRIALFGIGLVLAGLGALLVAMAFDAGLHLNRSEDLSLLATGAVTALLGAIYCWNNLPGVTLRTEPVNRFLASVEKGIDATLA
jgi:hypothetical protein